VVVVRVAEQPHQVRRAAVRAEVAAAEAEVVAVLVVPQQLLPDPRRD